LAGNNDEKLRFPDSGFIEMAIASSFSYFKQLSSGNYKSQYLEISNISFLNPFEIEVGTIVNCHIGKGGKFKFFSPSQESLLYCTGNVEMVDNYDLSSHQENIIHPSLDSIKYRCNSKLDLQKYPQIILPEPYLKLLEGNHIWICNEIDLSTTEMLVNINSPIDSDKYYIHPYIIDLVLYLIPILSCINSGNQNNNDYQTRIQLNTCIMNVGLYLEEARICWIYLRKSKGSREVYIQLLNQRDSIISLIGENTNNTILSKSQQSLDSIPLRRNKPDRTNIRNTIRTELDRLLCDQNFPVDAAISSLLDSIAVSQLKLTLGKLFSVNLGKSSVKLLILCVILSNNPLRTCTIIR
jgi:hypothetical protein